MKEFQAVFQISKMVLFEVNYYHLCNNEKADFSTSAEQFVRNKRGYSACGQCQKDVLPKLSKAYKFYKKWNKKHLQELTEQEFEEMYNDLEELKQTYSYMQDEFDINARPYNPYFGFDRLVEFSKQTPFKPKK